MVLDAWHLHIKRTNDVLDNLSDEQFLLEVSHGRNRGVYLLGHLTAIHDRILPLLGLGEPLHPQLYNLFVLKADKTTAEIPDTNDLRLYWNQVNATLAEHFSKIAPETWFEKHNAVSAEDFAKEPHRNKLNLVINRTNHLSNHLGQLIFLKS
jgi:hypothetical protein